MIRPLIILSILCFTVLSCEKTRMPDTPELDEYGLPVYSETGSNTVAFLLNGEPWVNGRKGGISNSPNAVLYNSSNNMSISAFLKNDDTIDSDRIYIQGRLSNDNGYVLRIIEEFKPKYSYTSDNCYARYRLTEQETNNIKLTFIDTIKKTISGRFDFKFVTDSKEDCPDTLHVTQGRFDLKYHIVY